MCKGSGAKGKTLMGARISVTFATEKAITRLVETEGNETGDLQGNHAGFIACEKTGLYVSILERVQVRKLGQVLVLK